MSFHTEPNAYVYGIFSDLQGAWGCLRDAVVSLPSSELQHRLLFHIEEAMSWESIRDLSRMKKAFLLIKNQIQQTGILGEIIEFVEDIQALLDEVLCEAQLNPLS